MTEDGSVTIPARVRREGDELFVEIQVDDILDLTVQHEGVDRVTVKAGGEPLIELIQIRKPEK